MNPAIASCSEGQEAGSWSAKPREEDQAEPRGCDRLDLDRLAGYSGPMGLSKDLLLEAEKSRARVGSMTPTESLRAAALLRDVKPSLETGRQRELAEELAREFEERAAVHTSASPPS